jgi:hypothetical protein
MKELTRDIRLGRCWRVALEFKLADMWIGVYWDRRPVHLDIWICLVPCFPLHFWMTEDW